MLRILLNPWGSLGDLHPFLALGSALRKAGAEVTIATMKLYERTVKNQGFVYLQVGPHFSPNDKLILDAMSDPRFGTKRLITELLLPTLHESYREIEPAVASHDVTVTYPVGLAAMISCERHSKPWVGTTLAPAAFFSRYDPPLLPLCPVISRLARFSPYVGSFLRYTIKRISLSLLDEVFQFRRKLGLKAESQRLLVDAHSPHLNLAMFDDAFGSPQPDWPLRTLQTGACLFEGDAPMPPGQKERLRDFLKGGEAPVVVTLGSSAVHAPGSFFDDFYDALSSRGLRGIFLMGSNRLSRENTNPDHFLQLDYAPYGPLFDAAKVIVSHGGIGTLSQILRAGKPTLVVPFAHDQPDNASRITRLGVGIALPAKQLNASRAIKALDHLIHRNSFKERATEVLETMSSDGASRAAFAVLQMAQSNSRRV
jgi:rhamnosyltransferase subunit B